MPVLSVSGKMITRKESTRVPTNKRRKNYRKAKKTPQITNEMAKRIVDERIGRMLRDRI